MELSCRGFFYIIEVLWYCMCLLPFLGGVSLCIPYGSYSGTSLGGTTWRTLEGQFGSGPVTCTYSRLILVQISHRSYRAYTYTEVVVGITKLILVQRYSWVLQSLYLSWRYP